MKVGFPMYVNTLSSYQYFLMDLLISTLDACNWYKYKSSLIGISKYFVGRKPYHVGLPFQKTEQRKFYEPRIVLLILLDSNNEVSNTSLN